MSVIYPWDDEYAALEGEPVKHDKPPEYGKGKDTRLELMQVDEDHKLDPKELSEETKDFLRRARAYFSKGEEARMFVTYQDMLAFGKSEGWIRKDWGKGGHPYLTTTLNRLWKAGLITKYRRGIYGRPGQNYVGANYGVTFKLDGGEPHE